MKTAIEQMRSKSRRSFTWAAVAVAGATGGVWAIAIAPRIHDAPAPLRSGLDVAGAFWGAVGSNSSLSETYPRRFAQKPRFNGKKGMSEPFDPAAWAMRVEGFGEPRTLTLKDLDGLPKTEIVTKFKCIEGWSQIVQAKGIKFSDFLMFLKAPSNGTKWTEGDLFELPPYVYMETPDKGYYVGLDMKSMLHPQTILCWEMDGRPLPKEHGAPLRLVIPIKYGIKSIKRIGLIRFSKDRPTDYWYERGYDWYAGL